MGRCRLWKPGTDGNSHTYMHTYIDAGVGSEAQKETDMSPHPPRPTAFGAEHREHSCNREGGGEEGKRGEGKTVGSQALVLTVLIQEGFELKKVNGERSGGSEGSQGERSASQGPISQGPISPISQPQGLSSGRGGGESGLGHAGGGSYVIDGHSLPTTHQYIYVYTCYIYIYIYIYMCVYVCIYIHTHTHTHTQGIGISCILDRNRRKWAQR